MSIEIDCSFPGGNIVVDRFLTNRVFLHQDLRDTRGDWFYWYFRVRGASGRRMDFHFTRSNVIGVMGPGVSLDGGRTWAYLGKEAVEGRSFHYDFPSGVGDVRFSVGIPYTEENLRRFLRPYREHPHIRIETLCRTRKGRTAERLHLGRVDGEPIHRVLLTARHHCCEMIADYVLEGIMETILGGTADGEWFRGEVEALVIPFVDKDGVEDGDQGKNRIPRDHNRDYLDESIHPTVREIRRFVPEWSDRKLHFSCDVHCPWIRGKNNENIYFVGIDDQRDWEMLERFSTILQSIQSGPLTYRASDNLPFGKDWNTAENYAGGRGCHGWATEIPGIWLASSVEVPYANVANTVMTAESARMFGHDMARAIRRFLEREGSE